MGCPDGVLPVIVPLRLAPSESMGLLVLLLSDGGVVIVVVGLGGWMPLTLTPTWLPTCKCPDAFVADTEATIGLHKFWVPIMFLIIAEALVAVDINESMRVVLEKSLL